MLTVAPGSKSATSVDVMSSSGAGFPGSLADAVTVTNERATSASGSCDAGVT